MSASVHARVTVVRRNYINVTVRLLVPCPFSTQHDAWWRAVARSAASVLVASRVIDPDEAWLIRQRCALHVEASGRVLVRGEQ